MMLEVLIGGGVFERLERELRGVGRKNSSIRRERGYGGEPRRTRRMGLSPREREVLTLIADGCNGRIVSEILGISHETVKTHVSSVLRKLSARNVTQAVAVAIRAGVIQPPRRTA